jgi:thioredoxin-like negative regulator of GroEL
VGALVRAVPQVSPALEQLARDLAGKVKPVKVNVDTSPQISQRFGAQAIRPCWSCVAGR